MQGFPSFLVQVHVNKIDFNNWEYAEQRFQQYWSRKTSVESSNGSSHDNGSIQNHYIASNELVFVNIKF